MTCEQRGTPRIEVGLASEDHIQPFEPPCGLQELQRGFAASARCRRQPPPQQLDSGLGELVGRLELRFRQHIRCRVECTCLEVGLRCREPPLDAYGRVGSQDRRPLQECCCRRQATACLRPTRRVLELGCDLTVGSRRRVRLVPDAMVRVRLGVSRRCERAVSRSPLRCRGGAIRGRSHQRVAEPHAGTDLEQLLHVGPGRSVRSDAQHLGGAPKQRAVPCGIGGRQQHQTLRCFGQRSDAAHVVVLDVTRHRGNGRRGETSGQLWSAHPSGQLEQSQRVATSLGNDPIANLLVELTGDRSREERSRVFNSESFERQRGQHGKQPVVDGLANRQQ